MAKYENIRALAKSNCKPSRRAVTVGKHFCGQRPLLIIIVSQTSF